MVEIKQVEAYHDLYVYEIQFEDSTYYATSFVREIEDGELTKEKLNYIQVYENIDDFSERFSEYKMNINLDNSNEISERCEKMKSRLLKVLN